MNHAETRFQINVRNHLLLAIPHVFWFHVPNGGYLLDKRTGALLKAMGLRPGIPDLCFILPQKPAHWIELKAPKGDLSDAQADVIANLRRLGSPVEICRSLKEVEAALKSWGIELKATVSA